MNDELTPMDKIRFEVSARECYERLTKALAERDEWQAGYAQAKEWHTKREEELLLEIGRAKNTNGKLRTALDWAANCVEAALDYHAQGGAMKGMEANQQHFRDCLEKARKILVETAPPPAAR